MLFCSIVSWIKTDDPSSVEYWSRGGDWDYFKKVVDVRGAPSVAGKLSFDDMGSVGNALFLFLFVDFMDTSGTLYAMANYANLLDTKGNFEGRRRLRHDDRRHLRHLARDDVHRVGTGHPRGWPHRSHRRRRLHLLPPVALLCADPRLDPAVVHQLHPNPDPLNLTLY